MSNLVFESKLNEHLYKLTGLVNETTAHVLPNLNAAISSSGAE